MTYDRTLMSRVGGTLAAATILAGGWSSSAVAQTTTDGPPVPIGSTTGAPASAPASTKSPDNGEEIVVTGYRQSLASSANAKKNTTNFTDSIFAEDIGKFPDLNLAESLQRLPGVQIDRDVSGEGTYINVRGLSAGFTVLTLNGLAVNTSANGGNQGRGSSLDILPSELFRRLTLSKSPTANMVEGGTAGTVDLQPVRAFDRTGFHVNIQAQDTYQDVSKSHVPRGAVFISDTFENTPLGSFGILIGGAYAKKNYRSEIFNTVGYTTLNLARACPSTSAGCNSLVLTSNPPGYGGGAGATLTTVPRGLPSEIGLGAAGSPLVECGNGTPGGTSGLSCQDLSYTIVPRLMRAEQIAGKRDRSTGMLNVEWRPTDTLRLKVDSIYTETNNNFGQYDLMMVVRSYNNNIPVNFKIDPNNVLTSGTFANTYFLNQSQDTRQYTRFFYRSAQADWDITSRLHLAVQGMMNTGRYKNDFVQYTLQSAPGQVPVVAATPGAPSPNLTPLNTGQYATYNYAAGDLTPTIKSNIDLPNYTGWSWNDVSIIPQRQNLKQKAIRGDLTWGKAGIFQVSTGVLVSSSDRLIASWNALSCTLRASCGSTITAQYPSVIQVIPDAQVPNYLTTLPSTSLFKGAPFNVGYNSGWKVPDFKKIRDAVNLDYFGYQLNPGTDSSNYMNTYSPRVLNEDIKSAYLMIDGHLDVFGNELRYNFGGRYSKTKQTVAGIVNDAILVTGTGTRVVSYSSVKYNNFLPSVNFAYLLSRRLLLRGAAARTITRPNPEDLLPSYGLSQDGDQFTVGNPALRPFYANNYDAGIEWYPKSNTVITFNLWKKDIYNYPAQIQANQLFTETGLAFSKLSARQQAGVTNLGNGDPNQARINVIQKQNSSLVIHLLGEEFQWIQPLDFLVKGVGFNVNLTHIGQKLTGPVPPGTNPTSLLSGLAPWTYNGTLYYETRGGFSVRVSYTHRDANLSTVCPCNNINGDLYTIATNYIDAQLTFPLPWYNRVKFTVQAQNLGQQVQLNRYRNLPSQPDGATYAGRTLVVGVRADF